MTKTLKSLRDEIDAIDMQLIELLRRRADVVEQVRGVKGRQPIYIRPGREADMLRVLLKQPMGHIPPGLIHRLWREMIGAFTLQEGNQQGGEGLRIAVPMPPDEEGMWDIARDHFGSFTPMQGFATATDALKAVMEKKMTLAALPRPLPGDSDHWWRLLLASENTLRISYCFPFDGVAGNARALSHQALVVGSLQPEDTGADRSILLVEWKPGTSMETARQLVSALSPAHHVFTAACSWIEMDGFTPDPAALKEWQRLSAEHVLRHTLAGAYPVPLSP
jgi:chorismate mutase/prephenate dehydratase